MTEIGNPKPALETSDGLDYENRAFRHQRVVMLFSQLPLIFLADIVAGGFLFLVLVSSSNTELALFWISTLVITTVVRAFLAKQFRPQLDTTLDVEFYQRFLVTGALISGIIWGNAWLLLPDNPAFIQVALVTLWLAGMTAGAATTTSLIKPVFLAFAVPAGFIFIAYIFLQVEVNKFVLVGAYVMYLGFILPISYRISREFNETVRLQIHNTQLQTSLREEAARLREKEQELSAQLERGDLLQTEKDSANERLQDASEERLFLLDAIGEGVFGLDRQGRITFSSRSALSILQCSQADLLNEFVLDFIVTHDGSDPMEDECYLDIANCLEKGIPLHNKECLLAGKGGLKVPVRLSCIPMEKKDHVFGAVLSFMDVSEQKEMEAMLMQSQKMEAIGRLTGGVAHDFNNLLTVILGNLQFLKKRLNDDPQAQTLVEKIMNAAKSGGDLNNRLLSFSREQTLENEVIVITELLDEMKVFLERLLGEHIELDIDITDGSLAVNTDRTQLQNAILNLCVNARDAMPEGGKLTITAKSLSLHKSFVQGDNSQGEEDYIEITVSDNGIGIPANILKHIFEPFFSTKQKERGGGLGLATVYGFIRQSRGNITVDSRQGEWTKFRIYLPRADTIVRKQQQKIKKPLPGDRQFSGKILVVEDDPDVREVAVAALSDAGFEVIPAVDGQDGLSQFEANSEIDLVFSDVIMPGGMNGIEMAERLLRLAPELPIILATGYTDKVLRESIQEFSNVVFLSKPYDTQALPGLVQSMMAR